MAPLCCPRCRLLQRARQCIDCGAATASIDALTRPRIEGLTTLPRKPPVGWRDTVALGATVLAALVAGSAAVVVLGDPAGFLAAPAVCLFGYSKQFWKAAVKRRPQLDGVAPPGRPAGEPLIGVAQPFQRSVAFGALALGTTIENTEGVIVRAVEAEPFWLVLADRRVLVAGACAVAGATTALGPVSPAVLRELEAERLAIGRASRARLRVARVAIAPGDRIAVVGRVRDEQLAGAGGYRDSLIEAIRGEPGALVWIERLAPEPDRVARALDKRGAQPP